MGGRRFEGGEREMKEKETGRKIHRERETESGREKKRERDGEKRREKDRN